MDPYDLLKRNHDIHLHSREFSDGWHTLEEVVAYGLRRQTRERWLGISEHSPRPENTAPIAKRSGLQSGQSGRTERWRDPGETSLWHCLETLRSARPNLEANKHARVLIGLELGWLVDTMPFSQEALSGFDYLLAAYHDRGIRNPSQAREFLLEVVSHPLTDILAHPDAFLSKDRVAEPGQMAGVWRVVFQHMSDLGVLCEYNLTTPLSPEVFGIARDESEVRFVIGSDLHDFRRLSTRRIMDAWGESQAGGFPEAQEYLLTLVERDGEGRAVDSWRGLFASPEALAELESKIYARTRRNGSLDIPLSPAETSFIQRLDELPEGRADLDFQVARMRRFASLSEDRIASTLGVAQFLELTRKGRVLRKSIRGWRG